MVEDKRIFLKKGERNALLIIAALILIWQGYVIFFKTSQTSTKEDISIEQFIEKEVVSTPEKNKKSIKEKILKKQTKSKEQPNKVYSKSQRQKVEYFNFDPNTIDSLNWLRLGVKPWTIKTILKYRSTGAQFRKCEDLKNIYTLDSLTYISILPYCNIQAIIKEEKKPRKKTYNKQPFLKEEVNINLADTSQLKKLSGVGSYFAQKIVNYRNSIGGFHSKEQILDVYNIDPELLQKNENIICSGPIQKININEATPNSLYKHPFFREKKLNKIICNYRKQHGPFESLEDLRKIKIIDDKTFNKIIPYLSL